jgi:small basic protein (TIGR04137 family)
LGVWGNEVPDSARLLRPNPPHTGRERKRRAGAAALVPFAGGAYHDFSFIFRVRMGWVSTMSIDKSLRRKNSLERSRNVLTRGERIAQMQKEERWPADGRSPYNLPKTRVAKIAKKAKKAKEEEAKTEEGATPAAAGAEKKVEKKGDKK